jgi:hypothetical protein
MKLEESKKHKKIQAANIENLYKRQKNKTLTSNIV